MSQQFNWLIQPAKQPKMFIMRLPPGINPLNLVGRQTPSLFIGLYFRHVKVPP